MGKVEKPYDEAAEAKRHIGFAIPEEPMNRQFAGELISEAVAMLIILAFGDSVAATQPASRL